MWRKREACPRAKQQRNLSDGSPSKIKCSPFPQVHSFPKLTWTKWMNKDLSRRINQAGRRWECQQIGSGRVYFPKFQGNKLLLVTCSPGWWLGAAAVGWGWAEHYNRPGGEKKMQIGSWMSPRAWLTEKNLSIDCARQSQSLSAFRGPNWKSLDKCLLQTRAQRKPLLVNRTALPKLTLS